MDKLQTKIIATIGPATLDFTVFQKLITEGIDFIRINTSYGDADQYDRILSNLRQGDNQSIQVIYDIKHISDLDYALKNGITTIALSFAENHATVEQVRKRIPQAFVISKIESVAGVTGFDDILSASDGIMVARGDLGTAVSLEKVPPLQKDFTLKTLKEGKFLITATEMLLSMVSNPKPSRAEVSDVANAVFENSSAVMLSEETAIGSNPVEAVSYMRRIIKEAEDWKRKQKT